MGVLPLLLAAALAEETPNHANVGGQEGDYAVAMSCFDKLSRADAYSRTLIAASGNKSMADNNPLNKPAIERFGIIIRWEGKRAGMSTQQIQNDLTELKEKANSEIRGITNLDDIATRQRALQNDASSCVSLL